MENEKIVVLNSGGFDSTVLLHKVVEEYGSLEKDADNSHIISLFFDYGQRNLEKEYTCSCVNKGNLHCSDKLIHIPPLDWNTSNMDGEYDKDKSDYIEMRNLIFFSYAISYAQSIGATRIFAAILKNEDEEYIDVSPKFLEYVSNIAGMAGIRFSFPFSEYTKYGLSNLAFYYGITDDMFFSCNHPVYSLLAQVEDSNELKPPNYKNAPCRKCPDCKAIDTIMSFIDPFRNPLAYKCRYGFNSVGSGFTSAVMNSPIEEMRIYTNTKCQLHCEHCYYGFEDMVGEPLTEDEYRKVIRQAKEIGIKNFHFSGKEPLYDERIFDVVKIIKEEYPEATYDVVTNGINVPKYLDKLRDFKRVCVSVDGLTNESAKYRNYAPLDSIKELLLVGIPVEVFLDVHKKNFMGLRNTVTTLYDIGVRSFYVRVIRPIGKAVHFDKLTIDELNHVFSVLTDIYYEVVDFSCGDLEDIKINVTLAIPGPYTKELLDPSNRKHRDYLVNVIQDVIIPYANGYLEPDFGVNLELFCGKYVNSVTLTPDGYIQGCASECSCKNYVEESAGNIRDSHLGNLIFNGKLKCIKDNKAMRDENGEINFVSCPHESR